MIFQAVSNDHHSLLPLLLLLLLQVSKEPDKMATPSPATTSTDTPGSITIKILFFASAREMVGGLSSTTITLPLPPDQPGVRPQDVRNHLASSYPSLLPIIHEVTLALNLEYLTRASESQVWIKQGDEVALIPPISGG